MASLGGESRCTPRVRVSGSLASDWLPALNAAPAGAQQSRTFSIGGSRFRSIAPARWRHAGVTSYQAADALASERFVLIAATLVSLPRGLAGDHIG